MAYDNFSKDDNKIELKTTSKRQDLGNANIQFYNMDSGTAILNFIVTKNDRPFQVGPSNCKATIALKTSNYNVEQGVFISDDLTFEDPINGRLSYSLPDSILSYTGTVNGQVYFAQNGNSNVIVERQFSFDVANDLISDFPGVTKLTYIKSLNDITENMSEQVALIKESLGGSQKVVDGINATADDAVNKIIKQQNDSVKMLTSIEDEHLSIFKAKTDGFLDEVDKRQATLNQRFDDIHNQIGQQGLLLDQETQNWQKYKLTEANGYIREVAEGSIEQILADNQTTDIVHVINATDAPSFNIDTPIPDDPDVSDDTDVIADDTPTDIDGIYDDPEENTTDEAPSNTTGGSGILTIYRTESVGRATWQPDDIDVIYTKFYQNGVWHTWSKINDENISKQYITDNINAAISNANAYTDDKVIQSTQQQQVLTNNDGTRKYIGTLTSSIANLGPGFYEGVASTPASSTNLPTDVSDAAFIEIDVYTSGKNNRKQIKVIQSSNGRTWWRYIHTDNTKDTGWLETPQGLTYTTTLFEGSANAVGTTINLVDSLKNYIFLFIYGEYPGGEFTATGNPANTRNINIDTNNLTGFDAANAYLYECSLSYVSDTQLKINSDNYFDVGANKPSGESANKFIIQKIVGVRK